MNRVLIFTASLGVFLSGAEAQAPKLKSGPKILEMRSVSVGKSDTAIQVLHYDGVQTRLDFSDSKGKFTVLGKKDSVIVLRHGTKDYLKFSLRKLSATYVKLSLLKKALLGKAPQGKADSLKDAWEPKQSLLRLKNTGDSSTGAGLKCKMFLAEDSTHEYCLSRNAGKVKLSNYNLEGLLEQSETMAFISNTPFFVLSYDVGDKVRRFGLLNHMSVGDRKMWTLKSIIEVPKDTGLFSIPSNYVLTEMKSVIGQKP